MTEIRKWLDEYEDMAGPIPRQGADRSHRQNIMTAILEDFSDQLRGLRLKTISEILEDFPPDSIKGVAATLGLSPMQSIPSERWGIYARDLIRNTLGEVSDGGFRLANRLMGVFQVAPNELEGFAQWTRKNFPEVLELPAMRASTNLFPEVTPFEQRIEGIRERSNKPRAEGGFFNDPKSILEHTDFTQNIPADELWGQQDLLRSQVEYSNEVTNAWAQHADPSAVRSNRYIHWMSDPDGGNEEFLRRGLQGIQQGEINAMVYPEGAPLNLFEGSPFASSGFGIIVEGDVRYISNEDAFSFPTGSDHSRQRTGLSGDRRYLPSSRYATTRHLALTAADAVHRSGNMNEASIGNFRIKAFVLPSPHPRSSQRIKRLTQELQSRFGEDVPLVQINADDPSRVVPAYERTDFGKPVVRRVGDPRTPQDRARAKTNRARLATAQEASTGSSQIAPLATGPEEGLGGQKKLFLPHEAPYREPPPPLTSSYSPSVIAALDEKDEAMRNAQHPDQLRLPLDEAAQRANDPSTRRVFGWTAADVIDVYDDKLSPVEKKNLMEAWSSGTREDIARALRSADIQDWEDTMFWEDAPSLGEKIADGTTHSRLDNRVPHGSTSGTTPLEDRQRIPRNAAGQGELWRNYTHTPQGPPIAPTTGRVSSPETPDPNQLDLFPEEAEARREFEDILNGVVGKEVDDERRRLIAEGIDPHHLEPDLATFRHNQRELYRARFNEELAEKRAAEREAEGLIRRDAAAARRQEAANRALRNATQQNLFAPGEAGGAFGPRNPQEQGSSRMPSDAPGDFIPPGSRRRNLATETQVRELSPQESANLRAEATQAHRAGNWQKAWRALGILGDVAFAAQLGYNIHDQGSVGRGLMETGAQEVEGMGTVLRAPATGAEMLTGQRPEMGTGLGNLSALGDAAISSVGAHRREQARAANRGFAERDYQSRIDAGLDPQESRSAAQAATARRAESLQRGGTPVSMEPRAVPGRSVLDAMNAGNQTTSLPDRETLLRNLGIRRQ